MSLSFGGGINYHEKCFLVQGYYNTYETAHEYVLNLEEILYSTKIFLTKAAFSV